MQSNSQTRTEKDRQQLEILTNIWHSGREPIVAHPATRPDVSSYTRPGLRPLVCHTPCLDLPASWHRTHVRLLNEVRERAWLSAATLHLTREAATKAAAAVDASLRHRHRLKWLLGIGREKVPLDEHRTPRSLSKVHVRRGRGDEV